MGQGRESAPCCFRDVNKTPQWLQVHDDLRARWRQVAFEQLEHAAHRVDLAIRQYAPDVLRGRAAA